MTAVVQAKDSGDKAWHPNGPELVTNSKDMPPWHPAQSQVDERQGRSVTSQRSLRKEARRA